MNEFMNYGNHWEYDYYEYNEDKCIEYMLEYMRREIQKNMVPDIVKSVELPYLRFPEIDLD